MQINVKKNTGQVMILSTILIGGAIFSATAIAGFALFFHIRQAGDAVQSAASFFAADAGIEETLFCYYKEQHGPTEDIDTVCDKSVKTEAIGKNDMGCNNGEACTLLASSKVNLSCFINPDNKTEEYTCKPPKFFSGLPQEVDQVNGIYILSKGFTARAERVLDYTIFTGSASK